MNKFFAILIMCSLSLPVIAGDIQEADFETADTVNTEIMTQEDVNAFNDSVVEESVSVPEALPSRFKEPVGKKALAKKFIVAMLCVVGTSIFLYGSLSLYNKLRDTLSLQANLPPEGETPLAPPSDLSEAVKTFVEKTNWNN